MVYNLTISEDAEEDIRQAWRWYEQQKEGLGTEFLIEVEGAFSSIRSHPIWYGFRKKNVRGCALNRFPYLILYFLEQSEIRILSVFHTHKKPMF